MPKQFQYQYYGWNPKDFNESVDVRMMTEMEELLYRRILDALWMANPQCYLPDEPERLARLVDYSPSLFKKCWPAVSRKLSRVDGKIFHERLVRELKYYQQLSARQSLKGKQSGIIRQQRSNHGSTTVQPEHEPDVNPTRTPLVHSTLDIGQKAPPPAPPSVPPSQQKTAKELMEDAVKEELRKALIPFEEFWKIYPKKERELRCRKLWEKTTLEERQQVMKALAWQILQDEWIREDFRYVPAPSNYIEEKRWLDRPPASSDPDYVIRRREIMEENRRKELEKIMEQAGLDPKTGRPYPKEKK